jgi:hypothetical protein
MELGLLFAKNYVTSIIYLKNVDCSLNGAFLFEINNSNSIDHRDNVEGFGLMNYTQV